MYQAFVIHLLTMHSAFINHALPRVSPSRTRSPRTALQLMRQGPWRERLTRCWECGPLNGI